MSTATSAAPPPRLHPKLREIFRAAESRHFNDEELAAIRAVYPDRAADLEAAREVREKEVAVVSRVVKEIFVQYPYEQHHQHSTAKCVRDVRYVVAYAAMTMVTGEPQWFENKLLIWMKTILQAFEFPDRSRSGATALFADKTMESAVAAAPAKTKSIYQCYYRLKQEMGRDLSPASFQRLEPYLDQPIRVLPAIS